MFITIIVFLIFLVGLTGFIMWFFDLRKSSKEDNIDLDYLKNKTRMFFTTEPGRAWSTNMTNLKTFTDLKQGLFMYDFKNFNVCLVSFYIIPESQFKLDGMEIIQKISKFKNCYEVRVSNQNNLSSFLHNLDSEKTQIIFKDLEKYDCKCFFKKLGFDIESITPAVDRRYGGKSKLEGVYDIIYKYISKKESEEEFGGNTKNTSRNNILEKVTQFEKFINENFKFLNAKVNFIDKFKTFEESLNKRYDGDIINKIFSYLEVENHNLFSNIFNEVSSLIKKKSVVMEMNDKDEDLKNKITTLVSTISNNIDKIFSLESLNDKEKEDLFEKLDILVKITEKTLSSKK